jgi:glutamate carboxypeptidase
MHPFLREAQRREAATIGLLRAMVECESPSDDRAAVDRCVELVAARCRDIAKVRTVPGGRFGRNLRLEFDLPGPRRKRPGQILGVGHLDTVWPVGTLQAMPWRQRGGRIAGPGAFDMKGGLAFFITAMRILRELDVAIGRKVVLWAVSDEEVGSVVSRPFTEREAKASVAVLVAEPGTGLTGKLKTARKGVGGYTVAVHGKAAHAGVDPTAGASAIVELAHQIQRIASLTDLSRGISVNPGLISGGSRTNVVAAEARTQVDIRIARIRDAARLDRQFRSLKPVDPRCRIEVTGGLNRPPMERTQGVVRLWKTAERLGRELGLELEESATGGGSDGNFTAGLGIPTLDGLGAVGEGAHAATESILQNRIADRTALLALLVEELGNC